MIYATTPAGKIVEIRDAKYLVWGESHHTAYEKKGGRFVAYIPAAWLVSFDRPDARDSTPEMNLTTALMLVSGNIRECYSYRQATYLSSIKKALKAWDIRKESWK